MSKVFKIPVCWEVSSFVKVEADSMEDAINKFDKEILEECELPQETEYIDGSFRRSCDDLPIGDAAVIYEVYQ